MPSNSKVNFASAEKYLYWNSIFWFVPIKFSLYFPINYQIIRKINGNNLVYLNKYAPEVS